MRQTVPKKTCALLRERIGSKRGTTLIECVLALILFSAVMVMAATMFSTANILTMHATTLKNEVNEAVNEAEITDHAALSYPVSLEFSGSGFSAAFDVELFQTGSGDGAVSLWKFAPPEERIPSGGGTR